MQVLTIYNPRKEIEVLAVSSSFRNAAFQQIAAASVPPLYMLSTYLLGNK